MILYCVLTSAINAIASFVFAVMLFLKRPQRPANVAFCWFATMGGFWSIFYFLWMMADSAELALDFCRWLSAAAILIPVAYFQFVNRLLGHESVRAVAVGHLVAVIAAALSLGTDLIVAGVEPKLGFPYWPVPGPLYSVYLAIFFCYLAVALWRLLQGYRRAEGLVRNQLSFVIGGTALGFLGGATNFLLWYDIPVPPVGNGLVALYVVGVGYAVLRFRLLEFNLLAARIAVYGAMAVVLSTLPPSIMTLLAWLRVPAVGEVAFAPLYLVTLAVITLLLAVMPEVRRRADALLEQQVLGERLADRQQLRDLIAKVSSARDEQQMYETVLTTVAQGCRVNRVAIYARSEFESDFRRCGTTKGGEDFGPPVLAESDPVIESLRACGRSLLLDEAVHSAPAELRGHLELLRRRFGIELLVPIRGDDFFYGVITVGMHEANRLFADAEVSLLEAVGLQIGLNLRARMLERRASQTEKLIALGTLAAGLAHELRNPLTSVKTFSALLREGRPDPEALQEFSGVVQRDVARIASIVENVSAFAESNQVEMTPVNVGEILRASLDIVRPEIQRLGVSVVLPEHNATVHGNHSQLLQVFLNLIQNALQAVEGRPSPRLQFEIDRPPALALVCVSVQDNGSGIDPVLLPRVFEPFTTTKSTGERRGKHGMGLGLAIVKRIVQHHQGDIQVASTPNLGTTFRVLLPPFSP